MRFIFDIPLPVATPSELQLDSVLYSSNPGLPKPNPGLKLANAFSVSKLAQPRILKF